MGRVPSQKRLLLRVAHVPGSSQSSVPRRRPSQALANSIAALREQNLAALHYTPPQNRFHHVCSSQAHTVCHPARSEGSAFYALEIAQQPNRGSKVREHFVRAQFQPCRKPTQKARSFSR